MDSFFYFLLAKITYSFMRNTKGGIYMKLYLVIERDSDNEFNDLVFGIFSTREKAIEIKDSMNQNFAEHNEEHVAEIIELELDKPTENYEFFIYN